MEPDISRTQIILTLFLFPSHFGGVILTFAKNLPASNDEIDLSERS